MKFKGRDSKFRTDNKRPGNRNLNPRHEAAPNTEREQRSDLIFGVLPVLEALRANARRVDKVFVAEAERNIASMRSSNWRVRVG